MNIVLNPSNYEERCLSEDTVTVYRYRLDYSLVYEKKEGRDCYSVRALQYKDDVFVCRAMAYDVSDDYERAKSIYDKVVEGKVFAQTLCDVVIELLG